MTTENDNHENSNDLHQNDSGVIPANPNLIRAARIAYELVSGLWRMITTWIYGVHIGSIIVVIGLLESTVPTIISLDNGEKNEAHIQLFELLTLGVILIKYQIFGLILLAFSSTWQWASRQYSSPDRFDTMFFRVFGFFLTSLCIYVPVSIFWLGLETLVGFQEEIRQKWKMPLPAPRQPDLITQLLSNISLFMVSNSVSILLLVFFIGLLFIIFVRTRTRR
jgi:hypothetical protein